MLFFGKAIFSISGLILLHIPHARVHKHDSIVWQVMNFQIYISMSVSSDYGLAFRRSGCSIQIQVKWSGQITYYLIGRPLLSIHVRLRMSQVLST